MARARCVRFFIETWWSSDTAFAIYTGAFAFAGILAYTKGQPLPQRAEALVACYLLVFEPFFIGLERERDYIKRHGSASYNIFDRKSFGRRGLEAFILLVRDSRRRSVDQWYEANLESFDEGGSNGLYDWKVRHPR